MGAHSLQLSGAASCLCRLCQLWKSWVRTTANNGYPFCAAALRSSLPLGLMLLVDAASMVEPRLDSDSQCPFEELHLLVY